MTSLSLKRVRTIMKTSDGADSVSKEATWLVARAAELFIKSIASEAYSTSNNANTLEYKHLTNVIHKKPEYEFLQLMLPKKITYAEYKKITAAKEKKKIEETAEMAKIVSKKIVKKIKKGIKSKYSSTKTGGTKTHGTKIAGGTKSKKKPQIAYVPHVTGDSDFTDFVPHITGDMPQTSTVKPEISPVESQKQQAATIEPHASTVKAQVSTFVPQTSMVSPSVTIIRATQSRPRGRPSNSRNRGRSYGRMSHDSHVPHVTGYMNYEPDMSHHVTGDVPHGTSDMPNDTGDVPHVTGDEQLAAVNVSHVTGGRTHTTSNRPHVTDYSYIVRTRPNVGRPGFVGDRHRVVIETHRATIAENRVPFFNHRFNGARNRAGSSNTIQVIADVHHVTTDRDYYNVPTDNSRGRFNANRSHDALINRSRANIIRAQIDYDSIVPAPESDDESNQ